MAKKIKSYQGYNLDLNVILAKTKQKNGKVRLWSLATTKNYHNPCCAVKRLQAPVANRRKI